MGAVLKAQSKGAASAAPASQTEALASLRAIDTPALEIIVETIIEILDARDGDIEAEDGDEDCCTAGHDIGSREDRVLSFSHCAESNLGFPGDPTDAEPSVSPGWGVDTKWVDIPRDGYIEMVPTKAPVTPFNRMIRR